MSLRPAAELGVPSFGPGKAAVTLRINGRSQTAMVEPCTTLLQVLRDQFGLTGAKQVCDRATCGACTVLREGKRIYSCSVLAIDAQGDEILTIESLGRNGELDPVQKAFIEFDASQCGYCTPGFVMSVKAFLAANPSPTIEEIRSGLSGNYCRCGTYEGIEKAILKVTNG
jgi:xanthine dehydrogenase YagT iron-sulfur-binding subunit